MKNKSKSGELKPLNDRCYEIIRLLRANEGHDTKINVPFLIEKFNIGEATANRDIKLLRDYGLVEYKNGTYVLLQTDGAFGVETIKNLNIIAGARSLLNQYKNTPIYNKIEQLVYLIEPSAVNNSSLLKTPRITVPPAFEYRVDNPANWDKICIAMESNCKIQFHYSGLWTKNPKPRVIRPYQLLLSEGVIYLFGYSEDRQGERLYVLNRMYGVTVLKDQKFTLPEDFDFASRCGGGRLGAFHSDNPEKYKIQFTAQACRVVKERKWADDQTFEDIDEETTIISFTSAQSDRVFELIMGWASLAKPLEPEWLVNRWKDEIKKLYKMI